MLRKGSSATQPAATYSLFDVGTTADAVTDCSNTIAATRTRTDDVDATTIGA